MKLPDYITSLTLTKFDSSFLNKLNEIIIVQVLG